MDVFLVYLNVNLLFCKLCFIMIEKKKKKEDDLLCNLRAEVKNMLVVNKIDTDVNNGISYKKHIEVLQNS